MQPGLMCRGVEEVPGVQDLNLFGRFAERQLINVAGLEAGERCCHVGHNLPQYRQRQICVVEG